MSFDSEITITCGAGELNEQVTESDIARIYDNYARPLYRYALSITSSPDDAEDAVAEVFARLAGEWKRIRKIRDLKTYLFAAVRNAAFSLLRSRRSRGNLEEAVILEFETQCSSDEAPRIERTILNEAFSALPIEQREVLVLKVFDGMTFKEIAATTHTSINTVASRYRYALDRLRSALEVNDNE